MPRINPIVFNNFSGGINCVKATSQLSVNELHDAQDMDLYPLGGISKRFGLLFWNALSLSSANVQGLYGANFSAGGGSLLNFVIWSTKIYSYNSAFGGQADITGGTSITNDQTKIWNFDILNDIVVACNGVDTPIEINSTPTVTQSFSGLPFTTYQFPIQYRGYMFYFVPTVSGTVNYNRCYFSSVDDPTTVDSNNFIDIGKGSGGIIKGAVVYNTYLYVLTTNAIYQIIFQPTQIDTSGDLFPFVANPNPIIKGFGTQSHRSITKFIAPTTHPTPGIEYVFFVDQNGIPRVFDGTITMSFDSKIGKSTDSSVVTLQEMDNTKLIYCHTVNDPLNSRLYFFLSRFGVNDTAWVLDYSVGFSIMRYNFNANMHVSCLINFLGEFQNPFCISEATSILQIGGNDTGSGDELVSGVFSAINDYGITGDFSLGDISMQNNFLEFHIRALAALSTGSSLSGGGTGYPTAGSMDVTYYIDGKSTSFDTGNIPLASDDPLNSNIQDKVSEIRQVGKSLRIRFESHDKVNDPLLIEQFVVLASPLNTSQVSQ